MGSTREILEERHDSVQNPINFHTFQANTACLEFLIQFARYVGEHIIEKGDGSTCEV